ncbi:MAG TPA: chemotaxis protein CheB [Caulobacteraceae bacterium]|jgi:two-component system chemotaxis response regulator CheB|nr:chemotaxis protein CheB [Caulobacteraceae bacterium]
MPKRDIIVIGGSSGSAEVLKTIVRALPEDLSASVFIATHQPAHVPSYLAQVLAKVSRLPVERAVDGAPVETGRIYVAVPDRHLLLFDGELRLGPGPRENMVRPAVDALFRSAALTYGARTVGVQLTGHLNDGAAGLLAIQQAGGLAVVQDPLDADAPDMPRAAIDLLDPDHVASGEAIGPLLAILSRTQAPASEPPPPSLKMEVEIAAGCRLGSERLREFADPVALTCPDCQGVLSEVRGARPRRYRCQTGHGVTARVLESEQGLQVEAALRLAMRVVEERIELVSRLAEDARGTGRNSVAELYRHRAAEYRSYGEILRRAVLAMMPRPGAVPEANDDGMQADEDGEEKLG